MPRPRVRKGTAARSSSLPWDANTTRVNHVAPGVRHVAPAQVLKRTAIKALGLPAADGSHVFSFERIGDMRAFKAQAHTRTHAHA